MQQIVIKNKEELEGWGGIKNLSRKSQSTNWVLFHLILEFKLYNFYKMLTWFFVWAYWSIGCWANTYPRHSGFVDLMIYLNVWSDLFNSSLSPYNYAEANEASRDLLNWAFTIINTGKPLFRQLETKNLGAIWHAKREIIIILSVNNESSALFELQLQFPRTISSNFYVSRLCSPNYYVLADKWIFNK